MARSSGPEIITPFFVRMSLGRANHEIQITLFRLYHFTPTPCTTSLCYLPLELAADPCNEDGNNGVGFFVACGRVYFPWLRRRRRPLARRLGDGGSIMLAGARSSREGGLGS